jgi:hypothetical protein
MYKFLILPMDATCPVHLTDVITLAIGLLGEQ